MKAISHPTQRAPDGWESARFLSLFLSFSSFPFPSFFLPSASNAHRWAEKRIEKIMNCKQCGAPLSVEEGQDFFHCQYCGSYDFPDPNQDGVALLDELSSYVCPLCEQPLVSAVVQNVHIFSCPHCRGNLIAQSKMLPILRQPKPSTPIREDVPNLQNNTELKRTATCPSCRTVMAVYPYGGPGNIIIQGCEQCQLIWLDFGELSRIVRAYAEMYNHAQDELGAKQKWIAF